MKKIFIILLILFICIGCTEKKETITHETAYQVVEEMFNYSEEEYEINYYKQLTYSVVNNKEKEWYAFLVKQKSSNYSYYVLVDLYGEEILNPVEIEELK